ncbi:H-NS histone family protein [Paracoccus onubensis]|uniref:H-NS histone family protein n=1 Tax=Paracoccus onubensis TaxID=1675788 RepID=UPI0027311ABD|nr:H-NS histone family protein [Paracoccus onubensis]MDP0929870.1 H-NS histone family protein [Paracoccus onubensis]
MAQVDLQAMDLHELRRLQREVEAAIANFTVQRKAKALAALDTTAKEYGFTLSQLVAGERRGRGIVTPKYENPEQPGQTWAGRGRKPKWVIEALETGKTLEDLAI